MNILETLEARGAVLKDKHFVYKSGMHGPAYINMDPAFPDMDLLWQVCCELAQPFQTFKPGIDVVVGAATGGIPLASLTALRLSANMAWADKNGEDFVFERAGFSEQLAGKQVLIVEDLLNTGDTTKKVIAQVRGHGGDVTGVSVVCNRGGESAATLDVPHLSTLAQVTFEALDASTCRLCDAQIPIVEDIGHGGEFKRRHPDYDGGYTRVLS